MKICSKFFSFLCIPLYVTYLCVLFTEFGNSWFCTGCTVDPVIVWAAFVLIDTMLRSKTTNRSFHNQFKSDSVGGDRDVLCCYWSRQVFIFGFFSFYYYFFRVLLINTSLILLIYYKITCIYYPKCIAIFPHFLFIRWQISILYVHNENKMLTNRQCCVNTKPSVLAVIKQRKKRHKKTTPVILVKRFGFSAYSLKLKEPFSNETMTKT